MGRKVGRPRKELGDEQNKLVVTLLGYGLSVDEVSAVTDVSRSVLYANFRTAIKNGMENFRGSLKREQARKALAGDTTMLIWLGKQYLGQKDGPKEPPAESLPVLRIEVIE
jgi:hypothetical protein